MEIKEFFQLDEKKKNGILSQIKECDWGAAKFLYELITENKFFELCKEGGKLFVMLDNDKLVSFATLTKRDCVDDDSLYLWIGFVFTQNEYRGHRYSGEVIEYAVKDARRQGYSDVYIATDHTGLYEKYGFEYLESRRDIYGEDSRIYHRKL